MLSIDFIRENKDAVLAAARNKNREVDIDRILKLDDQRREIIHKTQKLREVRNEISKKEPTEEVKARGREIKDELKTLEEELDHVEQELQKLLSFVPNVPLEEVPIGKNEEGNIEIRKWGDIPEFDFEPKSHIDLGESLDLLDLKRGTKVSGFRGYFLKNGGAVLHMAILMYVFQKLVKKGYTPLIAPSIVKGFTLFGSGQFPWGEGEVYKLNDEDAYLAGTAEVPVTAYYANEILEEKDLPKKIVAFSPCFRREAGSYGKDTRGLYRLHEFWKIEQVIIAKADMEEAKNLHAQLQENTQEILQDLELSYRVMLMCTGDMGEPQVYKYDTEVWMPYRNGYGEVASNSILGDFQARRLNIKYRKPDGTTDYCYTLNDTAIPSPRVLIALLENYQQKDGSIKIPKVLQNLCGFDKIEHA
jgi:seryl-tRNA synthetase